MEEPIFEHCLHYFPLHTFQIYNLIYTTFLHLQIKSIDLKNCNKLVTFCSNSEKSNLTIFTTVPIDVFKKTSIGNWFKCLSIF